MIAIIALSVILAATNAMPLSPLDGGAVVIVCWTAWKVQATGSAPSYRSLYRYRSMTSVVFIGISAAFVIRDLVSSLL